MADDLRQAARDTDRLRTSTNRLSNSRGRFVALGQGAEQAQQRVSRLRQAMDRIRGVGGRVRSIGNPFASITSGVSGLDNSLRSATGLFSDFFGEFGIGGTGALGFAGLATSVGAATIRLSEIGAEANAVQRTFVQLSGGAANAEANLAAMSRATRGLVDITTQQQLANNLLGLGIAENANDLERFTRIAGRLGAEFRGLDLGESLAELASTLANNSIPRLDSFGISAGRVRERIAELKEEGLDADAAFRAAFFEQAEATFDRLPPAIDSSSQALGRFNAQWNNFISNIGVAIENSGTVANFFNEVARGLELFNVETFGASNVAEEVSALETRLESLRGQLEAYQDSSFQSVLDFGGNRLSELTGEISQIESELEFALRRQIDLEAQAQEQAGVDAFRQQQLEAQTGELEEQNRQVTNLVRQTSTLAQLQPATLGGVNVTDQVFGGTDDVNQADLLAQLRANDEAYRQSNTALAQDIATTADENRQVNIEAAREAAKAWEDQQRAYARSFEQSTNRIRSLVEGRLRPTLDEVWQAPTDQIGDNFDEASRRLADLTTQGAGFASPWIESLRQEFGQADFFQPVIEAIESGDASRLSAAATSILTGPDVTRLWNVGLIEQQVRQDLAAQNARQRIIDQVVSSLGGGATGGAVAPAGAFSGIGTSAATGITQGITTALPLALQNNAPQLSEGLSQPFATAFQGLSGTLANALSNTIPTAFTEIDLGGTIVDSLNSQLLTAVQDRGTGGILLNGITATLRNQDEAYKNMSTTIYSQLERVMQQGAGAVAQTMINAIAREVANILGLNSGGIGGPQTVLP